MFGLYQLKSMKYLKWNRSYIILACTSCFVLSCLLLITSMIFTLSGQNLRDASLNRKDPTIPEESALHLKASDKLADIFDTFEKTTAEKIGGNLLAKAKDDVGASLKTIEEKGASLVNKTEEKIENSLQKSEEINSMIKDRIGSSALKIIEHKGNDLAKAKEETPIQEKEELVTNTREKIGNLLEKKENEEVSLLERAKDKIATSFKSIDNEKNSLLAMAKEKVQKAKDSVGNSTILRRTEDEATNLLGKTKDTFTEPSNGDTSSSSSLLAKAKETVEKSFLIRTLTTSEYGSLLGKAKEKVEKSLLGRTLNRAKETVASAKKFNFLGGKAFNSLFPTYASNAPKLSGLKLLSSIKEPPTNANANANVEVDDFLEEVPKEAPKTPEICYPNAMSATDEEPLGGLDIDSPQNEAEADTLVEYEEDEYFPKEFSRYANDDYYSEEQSEGVKGQKRHITYDHFLRKSKTKLSSNEIHKHLNRGIGNAKKLIDLVEHVDSFLNGKIRNSMKTLAQIYDNEHKWLNNKN